MEKKKFNWKITINVNIIVLKIVGLWPKKDETYKLNLYTIYSFITINLFINGHNFFQAANIVFVYTDLEALAALIFITVTDILASVKVYYFVKNIGLLKKLMITLNGSTFQPRNPEQVKLIQPGLFSWKVAYMSFSVPAFGTLMSWTLFPIIDGTYKDYRLPFSAWYPYDTKKPTAYEFTYIYQVLSIWFLATANVNIDTYIAGLMMYVGTQCELLSDNVKNITEKGYNRKLYECMNHHKMILKFSEDCNRFFDKIALGQFFTSALTLAISMFQLTLVVPLSGEFYSLLFYVNSMTVQVFLYCYFGNEAEMKKDRGCLCC